MKDILISLSEKDFVISLIENRQRIKTVTTQSYLDIGIIVNNWLKNLTNEESN